MRAARAVLVAVTLFAVALWPPQGGWPRALILGPLVFIVMFAELADIRKEERRQ